MFLEHCLDTWRVLCCASLDFRSHYETGFVLFSLKAVLLYNEIQEFYFLPFLIELMLQRHLVLMINILYYSFSLALLERDVPSVD